MSEPEFLVSFPLFQPKDFVFKIARSSAEIDGFWRLRRTVFCEEQNIFEGSDADELDRVMIPIVCSSLVMGMEDEIVGCVRIHENEPRMWWGSRLGVCRDLRRLGGLGASVSVRNRQPEFYARRSIGAGLIYKAVSTAHALGCNAFFAHVQHQNAAFFEKLHWKPLAEVELHGMKHVKMQADLDYYPPAEHDLTPYRAA